MGKLCYVELSCLRPGVHLRLWRQSLEALLSLAVALVALCCVTCALLPHRSTPVEALPSKRSHRSTPRSIEALPYNQPKLLVAWLPPCARHSCLHTAFIPGLGKSDGPGSFQHFGEPAEPAQFAARGFRLLQLQSQPLVLLAAAASWAAAAASWPSWLLLPAAWPWTAGAALWAGALSPPPSAALLATRRRALCLQASCVNPCAWLLHALGSVLCAWPPVGCELQCASRCCCEAHARSAARSLAPSHQITKPSRPKAQGSAGPRFKRGCHDPA